MSLLLVLDELGSEKSRSLESMQKEAQGEFGVACKAAVRRVRSVRVRVRVSSWEPILPGYLSYRLKLKGTVRVMTSSRYVDNIKDWIESDVCIKKLLDNNQDYQPAGRKGR